MKQLTVAGTADSNSPCWDHADHDLLIYTCLIRFNTQVYVTNVNGVENHNEQHNARKFRQRQNIRP